ncbi:hypothetical protein CVT26_009035 [Gymnopilus dilepis]|uniref:Heterokaryon incompatibility domain-containing protein n=1 Tax=Gymnopilus dilepis TaxID=231916 RepID=A0A409YBB0_9AGAR|nr:hypothetical protein CVT26_009035 [Gymnopilus dilepis]
MNAPSVPDLEAARKRPSYICEQCWTSVIANQLGLLLPPSEQAPSSELEWNTDPKSKYIYSVSEADIREADKQGCRWCHLIVQFASFRSQLDDKGDSKPPSDNIVEIRVGRGGPERDVLDITVNDELCWFGYVYTTEHDPASSLLPARNLVCEVGSDKALSLVTDLVNDCCSNHHDCPPVSKPYLPLPTRVIDCSDPSKPRLFISNERRDRYIALSYVWGEDQPYGIREHQAPKVIDKHVRHHLPGCLA